MLQKKYDAQRKIGLSNNFFFAFDCKTCIIKPFEKVNLKKILIKTMLIKSFY